MVGEAFTSHDSTCSPMHLFESKTPRWLEDSKSQFEIRKSVNLSECLGTMGFIFWPFIELRIRACHSGQVVRVPTTGYIVLRCHSTIGLSNIGEKRFGKGSIRGRIKGITQAEPLEGEANLFRGIDFNCTGPRGWGAFLSPGHWKKSESSSKYSDLW